MQRSRIEACRQSTLHNPRLKSALKIMGKKILVTGFFILAMASMQAQSLQLLLNQPPAATLSVTDCWNVSVSNAGREEQVYLLGIISDAAGRRLSEVRSAPLRLRTGINTLDRQLVRTTRTDYNDAAVQRAVLADGVFPAGDYNVCVAVMRSDDEVELGVGCLSHTVLPLDTDPNGPRLPEKKRDRLRFYGNAAVEGVYADQQGPNQALPPSYARLDFNPAVSLFQVPVTGHLHLTTERAPGFPDLNTYHVRFDRATFRQNLQNVLLRKLGESALKQRGLDAENLAKLRELDNLQKLLDDPSLRRELLGLDSLQNQIRRIETDPALGMEAKQAKIAQLRQRYDQILAKKRQVERLIEQKNRLLAFKGTLERSGQLEKLKNREFSLPNLSDPRTLRAEMKQYGLLEGANRYLFNIEELTLGTSWPQYSPLTLNAVQVEGGHFAWNPGFIYLAVTSGKTQSAIFNTVSPETSLYQQKLVAAKFGIGKIYGTHIAFSALRFSDNPTSISAQSPAVEQFPTRTTLGSSDFQFTLGKKRQVELSGEAAGLIFNRNLNDDRDLFNFVNGVKIPGTLEPNLSSGADFAWNGRMVIQLFNQNTRLLGFSRFVGPGFINPGTPGLRNDLMSYEGRLEQRVAKGRVRLSAGYRSESDNFSGAKGVLTERVQLLGEVAMRLGRQTNIRLQFIRNEQENVFIRYGADVLSANFSQGWKIGKKNRAHTNLNYLRFANAVDSFTNARFDAHYLMLSQLLMLPKGFSATLNGQYTLLNTISGREQQQVLSVLLSARLFKKANLGGGFTFGANSKIDQKVGAQLYLNYPISRWISLDIQGNLNQFSNLPGSTSSFQEQFIRGRLMFRW